MTVSSGVNVRRLCYRSGDLCFPSVIHAAVFLILWCPQVLTQSPLVIAVEDDAAPWSCADGTGFANDVVRAAFHAVGVEVEPRVMPYARCKNMIMKGEIAVCFSMSPSDEFTGTVQLSEKPLFRLYADYYCQAGRTPTVSKQEDLASKTLVGVVIGYEYPVQFQEVIRRGVMTEASPSESLNLKKLVKGRVDYALVNHNELKSPEWLASMAGVSGEVKFAFRCGYEDAYIGFSKQHPDGPKAFKKFNEGYALISANGTLLRIEKAWMDKMQRLTGDNPH